SLALSGGGGGNRTAGSSPDSDDSRTVSRTSIDQNTAKEHEQNVLPDILMTLSQSPVADVTRELAEVSALHALFAAVQRNEEQS
ncbi:MAG: hypothetical protein OES69_08730, partial [Myxococcales bacterium]|nr:hypothetical protein [Myxococcales bacterium]